MSKKSKDPVLLEALRQLPVDHLLKHEILENPVMAGAHTRYSRMIQNINTNWKPKKFLYNIYNQFLYIVRVS